MTFLRANVDVFEWQASDIPGVPREVIEHHLAVCPHARPVKQKVRKQALERQEFITEEIRKLEAASLVRGVLHPTWLANPVVVRKANAKWRLCIDYTDINKACPKDPFPLPRINRIVDSTAGCNLWGEGVLTSRRDQIEGFIARGWNPLILRIITRLVLG